MYCPPNQRRNVRRDNSSREHMWEFYATYTDGTAATVPGMSTMLPGRVREIALSIARRNDVQCVQPVKVNL